jgi:hypothetical protein
MGMNELWKPFVLHLVLVRILQFVTMIKWILDTQQGIWHKSIRKLEYIGKIKNYATLKELLKPDKELQATAVTVRHF